MGRTLLYPKEARNTVNRKKDRGESQAFDDILYSDKLLQETMILEQYIQSSTKHLSAMYLSHQILQTPFPPYFP